MMRLNEKKEGFHFTAFHYQIEKKTANLYGTFEGRDFLFKASHDETWQEIECFGFLTPEEMKRTQKCHEEEDHEKWKESLEVAYERRKEYERKMVPYQSFLLEELSRITSQQNGVSA